MSRSPLLTPDQERLFWAKVNHNGPEVRPGMGACWPYAGWRDKKGYGHVKFVGCEERLAHRVAWRLANGVIPEGMTLDHQCRNTSCVRTSHLRVMTALDNYLDGSWTSVNRTHCPAGHEYTPENTYRYPPTATHPNGRRECRRCAREYKAAYKRRLRAKAMAPDIAGLNEWRDD